MVRSGIGAERKAGYSGFCEFIQAFWPECKATEIPNRLVLRVQGASTPQALACNGKVVPDPYDLRVSATS
jgi:hypothetical protein